MSLFLSLLSFSGFGTNLVLVLHAQSGPPQTHSPQPHPHPPSFAQILSSPPPISFLSIYGILPYPLLSPRSLSPGVAGEIRGYYFLQSAESGTTAPHPNPLPQPPPSPLPLHTYPHRGRGQRNTSSLGEKPPSVLPSAPVGSLSSFI